MINFFISRPVFAWVLAIFTMLAGIMADGIPEAVHWLSGRACCILSQEAD